MTMHLPPTPLSTTGAPHIATPESPDEIDHSPVTGKRCVIDGVEMVEVTFIAHEPRGREVLVHVNSLTDAIRTRLDPAVMTPLGDTGIQTLSWWLPAEVLTAELVESVFGLPVLVVPDPVTGTPMVVPR